MHSRTSSKSNHRSMKTFITFYLSTPIFLGIDSVRTISLSRNDVLVKYALNFQPGDNSFSLLLRIFSLVEENSE